MLSIWPGKDEEFWSPVSTNSFHCSNQCRSNTYLQHTHGPRGAFNQTAKKRTVYFCQFAVEWSNNSHLKWFKNSSFTINQHLQRWKWYKQRQRGFPFIISIFIYWIWGVNNGYMAKCGFINASPVIFLQLESHRTWTCLLSCDWTWCFPCFMMLKKIIWSISWKSSHDKNNHNQL